GQRRFALMISMASMIVVRNSQTNLRLGVRSLRFASRYNSLFKMAAYTTASGKKSTLDLSGIYPPIVTPFDHNEDVNDQALQQNFNKWNDIGFRGYVVQGSNGEYAYMRPEEKIDLVRKVRQLAPADKLILAGSGCEATRDTIEMTRKMAEAGADAALVLVVTITKIGYMIHKTAGNNFQVIAGSASFLLASYCLGAVGGVCALANVLGREVTQLHQLFHGGKMEEAKLLQHKLILPNTAVTKTFGVSGLKASMDMMGYYGGPTRSPLLPLKDQQMTELKQIFSIFEGFQG
ncbi:hypothetical protein QZH41_009110, partial [Actinostola sp. cb2023]